jgi:hypothetical protein
VVAQVNSSGFFKFTVRAEATSDRLKRSEFYIKTKSKEEKMNVLQRLLMGLGTVVLLAVSVNLFAPKAVHAVVSTLVTVANTSANPVPTHSVDTPPLLQTFFGIADCSAQAQQVCSETLVTVPSGMTAVVQDVSATCVSSGTNGVAGPPPGSLQVSSIGSGIGGNLILNSVFQDATGTQAEYVYSRQTTAYFPSSNFGQANITFGIAAKSAIGCQVDIEGYYIPSNVTVPI